MEGQRQEKTAYSRTPILLSEACIMHCIVWVAIDTSGLCALYRYTSVHCCVFLSDFKPLTPLKSYQLDMTLSRWVVLGLITQLNSLYISAIHLAGVVCILMQHYRYAYILHIMRVGAIDV